MAFVFCLLTPGMGMDTGLFIPILLMQLLVTDFGGTGLDTDRSTTCSHEDSFHQVAHSPEKDGNWKITARVFRMCAIDPTQPLYSGLCSPLEIPPLGLWRKVHPRGSMRISLHSTRQATHAV